MTGIFSKKLEALKSQNRYRSLALPGSIDLTSNDYLGMRAHPILRAAALEAIESGIDMGAGGSRLLRGHTDHHAALEDYAASYFEAERALYFASGFQANYALFTTLPTRHDTIIFDSLLHASARDGIAASHAKSIKVLHNDLEAFEDALKKARANTKGQIWLAIESLYSMDGDFAPVKKLHDLSLKYDAILIVDEAHATGVWGTGGKGLAAALPQDNIITLHTCGKAIGVAGGLICAPTSVIDYMINAARPFIYSTAPPPLQALLTQKSLEILASAEGDDRRVELQKRLGFMRSDHVMNGAFANTPSQILPIMIGDDAKALEIAAALQEAGYDIRAIRPPTVPEGTARLRLSLSTDLEEKTLLQFSDILTSLLRKEAA